MPLGIDTGNISSHVDSGGLTNPQQWNHTCAPGVTKLQVALMTGSGGTTPATGVTYNSLPLTRVKTQSDSGFETAELWELNNPPTGASLQISATYGGVQQQFFGVGFGFTQALAINGVAVSATGAGANPAVNAVASAIGDLVIGVLASDTGDASVTTPGGTEIGEAEDVGGGDSDFSVQYTVAVGTSTNVTWTSAAPPAGEWTAVAVSVKAAPPSLLITLQPADINVINGQSAAFKIEASNGSGVLHYQWKKNGSNVGSDLPSYSLTTASTDNRALITCDVSDDNGTIVSRSAKLTISWHDVYLYSVPEDADPDDVRLRDPTAAAGGSGPHTITLNGVASTVAAGAVALNGSIKPVGVATTAATGTVGVNSSIKPVGDVRTNNAGTIALNGSIKPVGVPTTGAAGAVSLRGTVAPVGVPTTGAAGTVGLRAQLNPVGVATTTAAGTVALNGSIKPVGVATTTAAGTIALNGMIKPNGVASTCATGVPTLDVGHQIQPNGVASTCATGSISLRGTIAPVGVASTCVTGTVGLRGQIGVVGSLRTNNTGSIALNGSIKPTGVPSTCVTGHPTLDVDHFIHPNGVPSTCATGSPTIANGFVPPPAQQVEYGGGSWPESRRWSQMQAVAGRHVIGVQGDFLMHGAGLITIVLPPVQPKRRSREVREAELFMLETL